MSANSSIEWTQKTWNPVLGCTRISPGCQHCYAEAMSRRLSGVANKRIERGEKPGRFRHYLPVIEAKRWSRKMELVHEALDEPLTWRKPSRIFVNSMSDLFHVDVPLDFIQKVFGTMKRASQHQFQVLTKRADRLAELSPLLPWTENIWMGVSVENASYFGRIDHLRSTGAAVKFLSVEPLLGPVEGMDLSGIDWVIAGGESGPGARVMDPNWARSARDQSRNAGVAFFFKQFGKIRDNPDPSDPTATENGGGAKGGRTLDGRVWDEMPRPLVEMDAI